MKSSLLSLSWVTAEYLFLDLQRDSFDWALLDSLHQVSGVAGNLVAQSLGGDLCLLGQDLLVDVEVEGELQVVSLDELSRGSLHGLGSDSSLGVSSGRQSTAKANKGLP